MPALLMMITNAGLDALVDAEAAVTGPIEIVSVGLTDTPFVMAPTLTDLPGEYKVIDSIAGEAAAANIIHVTAYDTSAETYDVTGFGLYLADGTLFAVHSSSAAPILTKAALAFGLFSFDIAFLNDAGANITFGSAIFSYPPATEDVKGVARIATQDRVDAVADAGDDFETYVTPKTLRARLLAFLAPITASLDSLLAGLTLVNSRTVTGGGMASGGGAISTNPVITVDAAIEADLETGSVTKAVVPLLLGLVRNFGTDGRFRLFKFEVKWGTFAIGANTQVTVTFPVAFPDGLCFAVMAQGSGADAGDQDNYVHAVAGSKTASGFTAHNGHGAMTGDYIAFGS